MKVKKKQKRNEILYVRITPTNKNWVVKQARKTKKSYSEFINDLLELMRK